LVKGFWMHLVVQLYRCWKVGRMESLEMDVGGGEVRVVPNGCVSTTKHHHVILLVLQLLEKVPWWGGTYLEGDI